MAKYGTLFPFSEQSLNQPVSLGEMGAAGGMLKAIGHSKSCKMNCVPL